MRYPSLFAAAAILLSAAVALVTFDAGAARAQDAGSGSDPYPFCRALDLPPPAPPQSAPPAAAPAPGTTAQGQPAGASAPGAATSAGAAAAPAQPAAPPGPPTLSDLLKSSTDMNKIVDTLLDARAPLSAGDYDAIFSSIVTALDDNYVDAGRLSAIASYPAKYRGRIKSREDLDKAVYDLVQVLGDPATTYASAPDTLSIAVHAAILKVGFFGAYLKAAPEGTYVIERLTPGSTAELSGFRVGDTILSINDKPLKGLSKSDAESLELNPVGNQLKIESLQDGAKVERTYMLQENVPYNPSLDVLPDNIVYVRMPVNLPDAMIPALVKALAQTQAKVAGGVAGLVLDLRYVNTASAKSMEGLLPYFIKSGLALHEQNRQGRMTVDTTDSILPSLDQKADVTSNQAQLATMPLVVLINASTTAPGAQLFAAALQQSRPNTVIVGEHTTGDGVETVSAELPNCGTLTVATTRYLLPDGRPLGDEGVSPDVAVLTARTPAEGDTQLAKAVELVRNKSAYRPANVVKTAQTNIPQLGPPPVHAQPADDVDVQRIAHEHKTLILQGLVGLALAMCGVLFWLLSKNGFGRKSK